MASTSSRQVIVQQALSLAGRSQELYAPACQWLNFFLTHVASTFRFPELRKVGTQQSLAMGSATAPLPADLGAGMEKQGILFGDEKIPLQEKSYEDFAYNSGFPGTSGQTQGRPLMYLVDREAGVFRFNTSGDQNYPFIPVYFKQAPLPAVTAAGDQSFLWIDNDLINVEGCVWFIYKFMKDEREMQQGIEVTKLLNDWKKELVKMGGTSRIMPSPDRFKRIKVGLPGWGP